MRFPACILTALMLLASFACGQSADDLAKRGEQHAVAGEYDLAIQDFTEALRLKPDYPEIFYERAYAYMCKRDLDAAIRDLNQAIRLKPDYAEALFNRSAAYAAKGDNEHGMQDYMEAIRLKPDIVKSFAPATSGKPQTTRTSPAMASGVRPETGFVSEDRYSNAFFGFVVTWPEHSFLEFREPQQRFADILSRVPFRHLLFVAGGAMTVVIFADDAPGATFNDARVALGHESDFYLKSIRLGGRQFWKDGNDYSERVRYATTVNGYILEVNLISDRPGELKDYVSSVENLTFIDPARAKEMAGPDSWPALTQRPGWDSGVVTGNTFVHPMLHFSYEFPVGWHVGDATKAAKELEDARAAAQHWDEGTRKMYADEGCPQTLLSLSRFPEGAGVKEPDSRILLLAIDPYLCVPIAGDPARLDDPVQSDLIAHSIESNFQGAPFMPTSSRKVSSYSVDGHSLLEISGVSQINVPGEKTPVELHTAFIVSPLKYEWLGWGLVAGTEAELQELRKIKFSLRLPPPPVVAWEKRPQGSATELNDQGLEEYKKDDFEGAIQDFDQAIRLKPDFAAAFYNRGTAFRRMDDWERAFKDCDQAVRLNANYAEALLCRSIANANQRDSDSAMKDLNEAIRLKPDYAEALEVRGQFYYGKGDYDRALQDYSEAIRLKPDFAAAYSWRASLYRSKKHDYDHAIADYTEIIRLKPSWVHQAFESRGNTCQEKGDYDCAIRDLGEAIRLKPAEPRLFMARGKDYAHQGDRDHAIADFTDAIRLKPDRSDAFYQRGLVYSEKKDYDHAIQDFTQAIALDPGGGDAFYQRGIARRKKGEKLSALDDFSEAGQLNPSLLPQAQQQIDEIQKEK